VEIAQCHSSTHDLDQLHDTAHVDNLVWRY